MTNIYFTDNLGNAREKKNPGWIFLVRGRGPADRFIVHGSWFVVWILRIRSGLIYRNREQETVNREKFGLARRQINKEYQEFVSGADSYKLEVISYKLKVER